MKNGQPKFVTEAILAQDGERLLDLYSAAARTGGIALSALPRSTPEEQQHAIAEYARVNIAAHHAKGGPAGLAPDHAVLQGFARGAIRSGGWVVLMTLPLSPIGEKIQEVFDEHLEEASEARRSHLANEAVLSRLYS